EWLRTPVVCWLAVHGSLLLEGGFACLVRTRLRVPLVVDMMCLNAANAFLFCNALIAFNLTAIVALCAFLQRGDFAGLLTRKPADETS
ncbi:MAG: hypothetical protein ABW346_06155, partial [Terrimicrobium sp.]